MKRLRGILLSVLTALTLAFAPAMAGYCGIVNFDEEQAADEYVNLAGTTIYFETGVTQEQLYDAALAWVLVPESVMSGLVQYDVAIYLSATAFSDPDESYYVTGETHYPAYVCYASDYSIAEVQGSAYVICTTSDEIITETLLHEIGHVFDGVIATRRAGTIQNQSAFTLSRQPDWLAIYSTYGEALAGMDQSTAANMYDPAEAFAEAFRLYCSDPETLYAAVPEAYAYVEQALTLYAAE